MGLLSASRILDSVDLPTVDEPVPEWPDETGQPGVIRFRQLSAEDMTLLTKEMDNGKGDDGMYLIIVRSAIDADGNKLFTDDDIAKLKGKSLHVLNRLQRVCLKLNDMTPEAKAALKKD